MFTYFTKLVEQYSKVMLPAYNTVPNLRQDIENPPNVSGGGRGREFAEVLRQHVCSRDARIMFAAGHGEPSQCGWEGMGRENPPNGWEGRTHLILCEGGRGSVGRRSGNSPNVSGGGERGKALRTYPMQVEEGGR